MGLIYVNPEGPQRQPRPAGLGARHPRDLRAHGHERRGDRGAGRRRPHLRQGARRRADPANVGPEPEAADIEEQGLGWKNRFGSGKGVHTITSGIEGAWTPTPTQWDNSYFDTLFGYEWELTKSPAGAHQWRPQGGAAASAVPDAHDPARATRR
jgi:catalase-peroxidase